VAVISPAILHHGWYKNFLAVPDRLYVCICQRSQPEITNLFQLDAEKISFHI